MKPFKVDDVKEALSEAGIHGLTVTEVKGVWPDRRDTLRVIAARNTSSISSPR